MNQGRLFGVAFILAAAFSFAANAKTFPAVPGEYVVKLKTTTSVMNTMGLEQALGGHVKQVINRDQGLILLQRPVVETRDGAIQTLAHNAMVEYAEPNYIYKVLGGASELPTDSELPRLWGMINTGQNVEGDAGSFTGKAGVDIDAQRAWQVETGSHDVIVAVIDTGVNYANPELAPNIYTNEAEANGQPGVDDDGNGYIDDVHGYDFSATDADPMDVYGHGTHVSGTIGAAANNGNGVVGVAWNVRILPVRFLGDDGSGTLANAVLSIDYATKMKANIMSNSWGGGGFSQALMDSITRAKDAGILFVAAAGNSSNDNDSSPSYPAGYQIDNVIAVAAIDPTGALADFSNYGKNTVQLAAPGVDILSYTMRGLESWSGTSMATPHVTGVATLLLSQDMSQSYSTIKQRLLSSARPMAGLRGRVSTGLVNAYYALTNQVAPMDPNDPFNWQKDVQNASSEHPYADNAKQEWTFHVDGAKKVAVYFSQFNTEGGYDKVTFKNAAGEVIGTLSGNLGEAYGPAVDGDTVIVSFTSDGSVHAYGFDVGGIAYQ
jgi:subtilisin family serine protease